MARNHTQIGPYSKLLTRGTLDGRSREGRFLATFEAELSQHLGSPSVTQRMLIRQLGQIALRLALMDEKVGADGDFSERDGRQYLAWANSLQRGLRNLGLEGRPARKLSLAEHLAKNYGAAKQGAAA